MHTFKIDGETWAISKCGNFVRMIVQGGESTGWYALNMFNEQFKQAANK